MLAGYLKCTSKFFIKALIQADFNTFYPDLSLHGSIDHKQGEGSSYLCTIVNRFKSCQEVSFLPSTCVSTLPTSDVLSTNH